MFKREDGREGGREQRKADQWMKNLEGLVSDLSSDFGQVVFSFLISREFMVL